MTNKNRITLNFASVDNFRDAIALLNTTSRIAYSASHMPHDNKVITLMPYDRDGNDIVYDDSVGTKLKCPKLMISYNSFMEARYDFLRLISSPLKLDAELLTDRWFVKNKPHMLYWIIIGDNK